jgi:hypothetical protein
MWVIISIRMRYAEHAHIKETRNESNILFGMCDERENCGRARRVWEDNVEMGCGEIESG